MPTNTYIALASQTIGTAVSSVTFSGISQAYTDLVLVVTNVPSGSLGQDIKVNFNGDASTNYSRTYLLGSGSAGSSGRSTSAAYWAPSGSYNNENIVFNFMNYSNTTTNKVFIGKTAAPGDYYAATVGLWRSTAAITSIVFTLGGGSFGVGSTFNLYGIAASSVGAKATGGIIYQDASYFYHVFSGNGTFTPTQSISADVLVVAGGGGGAIGGGGAGGVFYASSQSLTATGYTCTVGGPGTAGNGTSPGTGGGNGTNSTFGSLTAAVGGGGAGAEAGVAYPNAGASGGSGGSGNPGGSSTQTSTGGTGYGFAGATSNTYTTPNYARGGGGGAGAVGNPSTSGSTPGGGGNGISTYSSILAATGIGENVNGVYYIAGGGGGSTYNGTGTSAGGYGGGGRGVVASSPGVSGLTNTGGGGGGTGTGQTSGAGGSGVIIVRYAK